MHSQFGLATATAAADAAAVYGDAVCMQLQAALRRDCSLGTQKRRQASLCRAPDGPMPLVAHDRRHQMSRAMQPQLVLPACTIIDMR